MIADIGIVEAGAELLERIAQARVAMRLHDGDDRARIGLARGLQRRGDLERIVRVIVDDGRAVPFADAREAPVDAAETGQAPCGSCRRSTPSSRATAMAASAFCTLCSPGMGRRMPSSRVSRSLAAVGR